MLRIKLSPFGKKSEPHYRIVVGEDRSKLTGIPAAVVGHYHPLTKELHVEADAVALWISKGAVPTTKVSRLLKKASAWKNT